MNDNEYPYQWGDPQPYTSGPVRRWRYRDQGDHPDPYGLAAHSRRWDGALSPPPTQWTDTAEDDELPTELPPTLAAVERYWPLPVGLLASLLVAGQGVRYMDAETMKQAAAFGLFALALGIWLCLMTIVGTRDARRNSRPKS